MPEPLIRDFVLVPCAFQCRGQWSFLCGQWSKLASNGQNSRGQWSKLVGNGQNSWAMVKTRGQWSPENKLSNFPGNGHPPRPPPLPPWEMVTGHGQTPDPRKWSRALVVRGWGGVTAGKCSLRKCRFFVEGETLRNKVAFFV